MHDLRAIYCQFVEFQSGDNLLVFVGRVSPMTDEYYECFTSLAISASDETARITIDATSSNCNGYSSACVITAVMIQGQAQSP
jgi:hypothetical protein